MKIISVNKGEERVVRWRGKEVRTGIFKFPCPDGIVLGTSDVEGDAVVDRKYHGGVDKAVYAYSSDHYAFWKERFPTLNWDFGMFGENLTVAGLDESRLHIGTRFRVGAAVVEVSQPRQPCFKLGIRFGTQSVLKQFVSSSYPGVYFRVIVPGAVQVGDGLVPLSEPDEQSPTILQVYRMLYVKGSESDRTVQQALKCHALPQGCKDQIRKVHDR